MKLKKYKTADARTVRPPHAATCPGCGCGVLKAYDPATDAFVQLDEDAGGGLAVYGGRVWDAGALLKGAYTRFSGHECVAPLVASDAILGTFAAVREEILIDDLFPERVQ